LLRCRRFVDAAITPRYDAAAMLLPPYAAFDFDA